MRERRSYRERAQTSAGMNWAGACILTVLMAWFVLLFAVLLWSIVETWFAGAAAAPDAVVTVGFPSTAVLVASYLGGRWARRGGLFIGVLGALIVWSMLVGIAYFCGAVVIEKYLFLQGGGCLLGGTIGGILGQTARK